MKLIEQIRSRSLDQFMHEATVGQWTNGPTLLRTVHFKLHIDALHLSRENLFQGIKAAMHWYLIVCLGLVCCCVYLYIGSQKFGRCCPFVLAILRAIVQIEGAPASVERPKQRHCKNGSNSLPGRYLGPAVTRPQHATATCNNRWQLQLAITACTK